MPLIITGNGLYKTVDWNLTVSTLEELSNLTHLTFEECFNQPLAAGMLPARLTHLTLGMIFNQQLTTGVLPVGLMVARLL